MIKEYDAIVVGGGMAGLTCAAYLCRYGYRTLLCEKTEKTGGLVGTFRHQGFAFDAGIRAFENSGIVFPMLKSLGIEMDFVRNAVSIGIDKQWIRLDSRDSLQSYASMLSNIYPQSSPDIDQIAGEIKKIMGYMDVIYGIDNPLFLDNMHDREYLLKTLLPWLLKYKVNIRKANRLNEAVYPYLRHFTDNQSLIDIIAQHFFKNTPTFFALSYFGLYLDYCYPKGGTGVLAKKMTDYIRTSGGDVMTETAITEVDASNNRIQTSDGTVFSYKKLVWAADQKSLYASVIGLDSPQIKKQRLLTEQSSGGDSILALFMGMGLDSEYFESRCGPHSFYTPSTGGLSLLPDWKQAAFQGKDELYTWISKYLELTTYEISCPALRDATLAPAGKTGAIVSTLFDYELVQHISDDGGYQDLKDYCTNKIMDVLNRTVFPGISENIEFVLCSTPMTIERETGNSQGAITGWAFTNAEMPAENRFQKIANSIKTPIKDVFQCGQWTFSPSGLPVSILTGKLAADAIHKTLKGRAK